MPFQAKARPVYWFTSCVNHWVTASYWIRDTTLFSCSNTQYLTATCHDFSSRQWPDAIWWRWYPDGKFLVQMDLPSSTWIRELPSFAPRNFLLYNSTMRWIVLSGTATIVWWFMIMMPWQWGCFKSKITGAQFHKKWFLRSNMDIEDTIVNIVFESCSSTSTTSSPNLARRLVKYSLFKCQLQNGTTKMQQSSKSCHLFRKESFYLISKVQKRPERSPLNPI